jgi:signal transduction histidine kinase
MFSRKTNKSKTLRFKLTALYITLYMCSFLLFLLLTFFVLYRTIARNEKKIVISEIQEIVDNTGNGNFEELVGISWQEIHELGSSNLLVHLKYRDNDYFLPNQKAWKNYRGPLPDLPPRKTTTLHKPDSMTVLRVGSATLPCGAVLHLGYISNSRRDLIELFLRLSAVIFVPILLIGIAIGRYMVTRSLRDISMVTNAAVEIYRGNLDSRVERSGNGDEIDQLSEAFNTMLSRISFLIKNMAEMVDNLAHDLRSPLTKLRANAEIALLSHKRTESVKTVLEKSLREYDRIISLINHLLSLSEAETGVAPLHFESVALQELLESIHEFYAPLAVDTGKKFLIEDIDAVSVNVDKTRLWQCLCNILDNAFKFTGEGDLIGLSAKKRDDCVVISIVDTGIGIAGKDLPYIFERFFKADTRGPGHGYGLGLSLSRAIAALHGGSIMVNSLLGEGTTFSVVLPAGHDRLKTKG